MICERFDVVIVPFPFTDRSASLRRPAVALTGSKDFGSTTGQTLLAMITQARMSQWPLDTAISDLETAGLMRGCVVRMKLFTLDNGLIVRRTGSLAERDRRAVTAALDSLLKLSESGAPRDGETG